MLELADIMCVHEYVGVGDRREGLVVISLLTCEP